MPSSKPAVVARELPEIAHRGGADVLGGHRERRVDVALREGELAAVLLAAEGVGGEHDPVGLR